MAQTVSPKAPVAEERAEGTPTRSTPTSLWWIFGGAIAALAWLGWASLAPALGFPALAPAVMLNRALHLDLGSRWGWAALILAMAGVAAAYGLAASARFFRSGLRSGLLLGAATWLVAGAIVMPLLALAVPDSLGAQVKGGAGISGMTVPTDPEAMRPTFMMMHLGILAPLGALIGWLLFGGVLGATGVLAERWVVVLEHRSTTSKRGLGLLAGAAVLAVLAGTFWVIAHPVEAEALSCGLGFGKKITGTVVGDVEVTAHGTICDIRGTVKGNIIVRDTSVDCTKREVLTAINVIGGTIEGDVLADGRRCVMLWLRDGSQVDGSIVYAAQGNLGFLGDEAGGTVHGDVTVRSGLLWATGASTDNRVDGDLVCEDAQPAGGPRSGSATDWDGLDDDKDGSVGGAYRC